MIRKMSNIQVDFIASHLRYQITKLQNVLDDVQRESNIKDDFVGNNLHQVENDIRQLRKLYCNL